MGGGEEEDPARQASKRDGARTIWVIAMLKPMGKCLFFASHILLDILLNTTMCESTNSVPN